MALTAETLRAIADTLDKLAEVPAQLTQVTVHGLAIRVKHQDTQTEGHWYEVTHIEGISDANNRS